MNCTSCGQPLGAVAHIYNDKLLCEACWIKIGAPQAANSPAHTVLIGQHDDAARAEASKSVPNENITTVSAPPDTAGGNAAPIPVSNPALLLQGEQVIWRRTFSKGIIHRHPSINEVLTNMRVCVVDDVLGSIVRAYPLANTSVAVTNSRRMYGGVRTGYGRGGLYTGTGTGTSVTYGDIEFVNQGNVVLVFHHVADPYGVKNLVMAALKSSGKKL